MYQKLPYYMAYPIQTEYDEKAERTDLEYMKSLYPDLPKRILMSKRNVTGWNTRGV